MGNPVWLHRSDSGIHAMVLVITPEDEIIIDTREEVIDLTTPR